MERSRLYFASDVHLGLEVGHPAAREMRFVQFLRSIPVDKTAAVYLLGDIWDFWYEYRDVVPKGSVRVLAAITDLIDAGVEVYFAPGNHDIWCYSYFESLGMRRIDQPHVFEFAGKTFCVGHGDGLGPGMYGYKLMNRIFKCRFLQVLFSALHPWFAFRLGKGWSRGNRLSRGRAYHFKGEGEPLYDWARAFSSQRHVDFFIFGHLHTSVRTTIPGGAELRVLDSWISGVDYLYFDATSGCVGHSMNIE